MSYQEQLKLFEDEVEEISSLKEIGDIREAFIVASDWTMETIYSQISKGNIDLDPKFQRRDVWSVSKKSRLIESILLRVPIPQIILAQKKDSPGKYIVIDGKQRLLAIKGFMENQLKLKDLLILTDLNGKTKEDFLFEDATEFENETLRSVFIRNWPSTSYLYAVFNRLNTGSTPLSPQELRLSLFPGEFTNYLMANSDNNNILELLNLKKPDNRMRDVELLLRYYAFKNYANEYPGKLKIFFDNSMEKINKHWDKIIDESEQIKLQDLIEIQFKQLLLSIEFSKEVFGEEAFKRLDTSYNGTVKVIFDLKSYYFSDEQLLKNLKSIDNYKEKLNSFYYDLFNDLTFIQSITSHTSDLASTKYRFNIWADKLNELLFSEKIVYIVKSPLNNLKSECDIDEDR